jgi:hypothetical protein
VEAEKDLRDMEFTDGRAGLAASEFKSKKKRMS